MAYSYKGFFRYTIDSGRGGIGIPVIAFADGSGRPFPWKLAKVLNDQDISGALYSAITMRALYLLLPNWMREESESKGKFHDLSYLQQHGGTLSISFAIEKYADGKLIELLALRDPAASVDSVDLVNQSYVWYTSLFLRIPTATLLKDGSRIYGQN